MLRWVWAGPASVRQALTTSTRSAIDVNPMKLIFEGSLPVVSAVILSQVAQQRVATSSLSEHASSSQPLAKLSAPTLTSPRRIVCGASTLLDSATLSSVVATMELVTAADRNGLSRRAMALLQGKRPTFNSVYVFERPQRADSFRCSQCYCQITPPRSSPFDFRSFVLSSATRVLRLCRTTTLSMLGTRGASTNTSPACSVCDGSKRR